MITHFRQAATNATMDYRNLKEFNENAAHEIQTPLAVIRAQVDLFSQDNISERQSILLQTINTSLGKLSKIQQGLLLLSKIENNQFHNKSVINLKKYVEEKSLEFQEIWIGKNFQYTSDLKEATLTINTDLIEILLNNMFSNIFRHTPAGGQVQVNLKQGLLEMKNSGNGELPDSIKIFHRFYSTKDHSGGAGLGLSIVKNICTISSLDIQYDYTNDMHRFSISWQDNK
jgi:signal transduction histidine kinase